VTTFHDGELAVQQHAGVRGQASRLTGMLAPPDLSGGASLFLAERDLVVLTARDREGRLWTTPIPGPHGFLDGDETTLKVHAGPTGPLADLPAGQPVGMIAIDFATRRRLRVNGTLVTTGGGLEVAVEQAYGNCPQYIQQRHLVPAQATAPQPDTTLIEHADTFFLGTIHPSRGADASHRGGSPGFVRVEDGDLWWPDYHGNNMFNSLGNLAVDSTAALLFLDFTTGATLHLSGNAVVEWITPGTPGDDDSTGRRVRFTPTATATGSVPVRAAALIPYHRNPGLSD
jgi:predicted pyridoxine 5'-phosphate oxidase superfamily flavin-nucleotide-binding protein